MFTNVPNRSSFREKAEFPVLFFFTLFMIFCFGSVYTENTSDIIKDIIVYHFQINIKMVIIICIVFSMIALIKKGNFDNVSVSLLCMAILGLVPYTYADNVNSYWGNYLPVLISFMSYYVCLQSKSDISNSLFIIICLVSIILSVQVILTELNYFSSLSLSNFNNVIMKAFMNLPIGSSNLVAAYLLPLLVFIISYKRSIFSLIISVLTIYAILLCRSKNAISIAILIVFSFVLNKVYRLIIKDTSVNIKIKLTILAFISGLFVGGLILVLKTIGVVISDLEFSYHSPYTNTFLNYLDTISSGRIFVFQNELIRFTDHMILGNGFGSILGQAKSHNWIIELLVQRGLIGFFIYLFCLIKIFKSGYRFYKTDAMTRACLNFLIVIFIQGLGEVTVFTIGVDFLIWSISGFIVARTRQLKYKIT